MLAANQQGQLSISPVGQGGYTVATLGSFEATEQQIRAALADDLRLSLAPWRQHPRDQNAAFVFDVIVVPE